MNIDKSRFVRLWYENESGDKHYPDKGGKGETKDPPPGFIYQHSMFPNVLHLTVLKITQKSEVEACPHLNDSVIPTGGWVDGIEGRKCRKCQGTQTRKIGHPWPPEWNSNGSEKIVGAESSWSDGLVLEMANSGEYSLSEAIMIVANSCERCMNSLAHAYGLAWGYEEHGHEWFGVNTECDFCKGVETVTCPTCNKPVELNSKKNDCPTCEPV